MKIFKNKQLEFFICFILNEFQKTEKKNLKSNSVMKFSDLRLPKRNDRVGINSKLSRVVIFKNMHLIAPESWPMFEAEIGPFEFSCFEEHPIRSDASFTPNLVAIRNLFNFWN